MTNHTYKIYVEWTGNLGKGTSDYKSYNRNHTIITDGKYSEILASSDPAFLGDSKRYNPEDLFLSSLSACHMLWYLHLCAVNKIIVISYKDTATGTMQEFKNGSGKFTEVTLHPNIVIKQEEHLKKAMQLHTEAHQMCFIANSCNFPTYHQPTITNL